LAEQHLWPIRLLNRACLALLQHRQTSICHRNERQGKPFLFVFERNWPAALTEQVLGAKYDELASREG
jgi:hypothetical protein